MLGWWLFVLRRNVAILDAGEREEVVLELVADIEEDVSLASCDDLLLYRGHRAVVEAVPLTCGGKISRKI